MPGNVDPVLGELVGAALRVEWWREDDRWKRFHGVANARAVRPTDRREFSGGDDERAVTGELCRCEYQDEDIAC